MTNEREHAKRGVFQIKVKGILDKRWSDWFDHFEIEQTGDESVLTGPVADQAALHGLLAKIRDLGVPLISVNRIDSGLEDVPIQPNRDDRSAVS